jgi:hypothetical protein
MQTTTATGSSRTAAGGAIAATMDVITNNRQATGPLQWAHYSSCSLASFKEKIGESRRKKVTELPFWGPFEIATIAHFVAAGGILWRILYAFDPPKIVDLLLTR